VLQTAAAAGSLETFRMLLEFKLLDIDATDGCGEKPLATAVEASSYGANPRDMV
jgi:hypothetical protein